MVNFDFWQDAIDNMNAERRAMMDGLVGKYGKNFTREELSFADQIEYDMAVGLKNAELDDFCKR